MKFAPEAWPFVLPFAALAIGLGAWRHPVWASVAALIALGLLLFFRDPARHFDGPADVLVAPADGVVLAVEQVEDERLGPGPHQRIITFLSVFDVHLQKVPTDGEVIHSQLIDGRRKAAFDASAGEVNARHWTIIRRPNGDHIGVVQVVGLLARRIVCDLEEGQAVRRGQRLGLIKFGSRVDLIVPADYTVTVAKGQRMRNGETVAARAPGATDTP